MRTAFEYIDIADGCSIRVYHRQLQRIPFELHHHPEYELTLTLNSQGTRYVGDSVCHYADNDLVLVPPDLPHTWSSKRAIVEHRPQQAIVLWFGGEWARRLASCCPEFAPLLTLLRRAGCGLAFAADAAARACALRGKLLSPQPRQRLSAALELLCLLADADAQALASPGAFQPPSPGRPSGHQPERINRVLATIDACFAERLTPGRLAAAGNLSVRSLNRYFRQHLGESVGQYLARVRIGHACRLLADTAQPVSAIAGHVGFASIANFNRRFRAMKSMSPAAYRKAFREGGQATDGQALDRRPLSLERRGESRGR
ncbi:helix-turn-helix domain-containing protein [Chromobacterium sp. CV08]|uniref:helix-turn-helix domain-containing protein n=1 Tax=Chromobacterium sp. CV08 TaxID=3133274 RepID=UPI003DA99581